LIRANNNNSYLERISFKLGIKRRPYFENFKVPNIRTTSFRKMKEDDHGVCSQIPEIHAGKQIVSVKRNLFERYISAYEYGDWKKAPWVEDSVLKARFPAYPNLNFEEYINMLNTYNPLENHPLVNRKLPVGPVTSQFILYYFKKPFKILKNIDNSYIQSDKYKNDMFNIHFLNQDDLNNELFGLLIELGYDRSKVAFILDETRHNRSTPITGKIENYFSSELLTMVKEQEAFLFKIFNGYYV
jgi:hypothetical protein